MVDNEVIVISFKERTITVFKPSTGTFDFKQGDKIIRGSVRRGRSMFSIEGLSFETETPDRFTTDLSIVKKYTKTDTEPAPVKVLTWSGWKIKRRWKVAKMALVRKSTPISIVLPRVFSLVIAGE